MSLKLVVRYKNGKLIKGTSNNFQPMGGFFHLTPVDHASGDTATAVQIEMADVKAVFYVDKFEGNPGYSERKEALPTDRPQGRKMQVLFKDGETMTGAVLQYDSNTPGFFFFPIDANSNNQKAFIVASAVAQVKYF